MNSEICTIWHTKFGMVDFSFVGFGSASDKVKLKNLHNGTENMLIRHAKKSI